MHLYDLLHDADDPPRRNRRRDLYAERFAVAFIDHIQRAEGPPSVERVRHEIERPDLVQPAGANNGWRGRVGNRRFVRRGRFSRSAQYMR